MLNYLKARWGETTSHAAVVGSLTAVGAYLDGKMDEHSLAIALSAAVIGYLLPAKSTAADPPKVAQ